MNKLFSIFVFGLMSISFEGLAAPEVDIIWGKVEDVSKVPDNIVPLIININPNQNSNPVLVDGQLLEIMGNQLKSRNGLVTVDVKKYERQKPKPLNFDETWTVYESTGSDFYLILPKSDVSNYKDIFKFESLKELKLEEISKAIEANNPNKDYSYLNSKNNYLVALDNIFVKEGVNLNLKFININNEIKSHIDSENFKPTPFTKSQFGSFDKIIESEPIRSLSIGIGLDHEISSNLPMGPVVTTLIIALSKGDDLIASQDLLSKALIAIENGQDLLTETQQKSLSDFYNNWFIYEIKINKNTKPYYLVLNKEKIESGKSLYNFENLKQVTRDDIFKIYYNKGNITLDDFDPILFQNTFKSSIDLPFKIYMIGHGGNSIALFRKNISDLMNTNKKMAELFGTDLSIYSDEELNVLKNNIETAYKEGRITKDFKDALEKYIKTQKDLRINIEYSGDLATITSINANDFSKVVNFLNKYSNLQLLFLTTCFGGGQNSMIPFFEKGNLKSKIYNYDIISQSNEGKVVYINTNFVFNLFDAWGPNANPHDIFSKFNLKMLHGHDSKDSIKKISIPIIRYKNKSYWEFIIDNIDIEDFNFYVLTEQKLDNLKKESKSLEFKKHTVFATNTDYIDIPVEFYAPSIKYSRIVGANLNTLYFEKLTLNLFDPSTPAETQNQNTQEDIYSKLYLTLVGMFGLDKYGVDYCIDMPNTYINNLIVNGTLFKNVHAYLLRKGGIGDTLKVFLETENGSKYGLWRSVNYYGQNELVPFAVDNYDWQPPQKNAHEKSSDFSQALSNLIGNKFNITP